MQVNRPSLTWHLGPNPSQLLRITGEANAVADPKPLTATMACRRSRV